VKIEITPYAAGHMIGGTIWQIKREADVIVYAVDYNHKKERHLSPTILETLSKPTLLITDSLNAQNNQLSRRDRDALLHGSRSVYSLTI
jgi:cleavage and polyadenylation specificity factor subunit 2